MALNAFTPELWRDTELSARQSLSRGSSDGLSVSGPLLDKTDRLPRGICYVTYARACGIWCAAELLQLRNLGIWRALLCAQCHQDLLHSDTTRDHCMSTLARAVA